MQLVQATWYANYGAGECTDCVQQEDSECQVETGRESVVACPVWQDHARIHEIKLYPPLRRE